MKPKKAKASTAKQPAKMSAKKQLKQAKAPTKGNTRKLQASDGSDDANSDNDVAQSHPKWKQQKKSKHIEEVDEDTGCKKKYHSKKYIENILKIILFQYAYSIMKYGKNCFDFFHYIECLNMV